MPSVGGYLKWGAFHLYGGAVSLPIGLILGVATVVKAPMRLLKRVNKVNEATLPELVPDLKHEFYDVGRGIIIHGARTGHGGAPEKPVMLLVHGFPEYWGSWRNQIQAFRDQYDVVAIDTRGYGQSSKPKGRANYRLDQLIEDIVGAIKALGVEKVVLCGHDWGGNICWSVAATHPELVDKLIIACCPHPNNFQLKGGQLIKSWYMFFFLMPWLPEAFYKFDDYTFMDSMFLNPPIGIFNKGAITKSELQHYKKEASRTGSVTAQINYYRALMHSLALKPVKEVLDALQNRKIQPPTLLLWAANDAAFKFDLVNGTDKYVENLEVKVLDNCSHWIQQDAPEEVNKAIAEFLARVDKEAVDTAAASGGAGWTRLLNRENNMF